MKVKHLPIVLTSLALSILLFSGCLKEGDETLVLPTPDGTIPFSVIPERLQDSLRDNGFVIHEGLCPPRIVGKYKISPMDLHYASDKYVNTFYDLVMTFEGQYRRGAVSYRESQLDTVLGVATDANVIGEGDDFTMYCYQYVFRNNSNGDTLYRCSLATVVSGTVVDGGFKDCQYSTIFLDKWAKNDYYASQIPDVETFRIWNDGNALAARIATVKSNNQ